MATDIFMSIETEEGDSITEGACTKESIGAYFKSEHEDEIYVVGFAQKGSIATDRLSGQITSSRRHEYLRITKLIDKSSPLLYQLLAEPKGLTCSIMFFRSADTGSDGQPVHYYSIELEGAKVVEIETISPNMLDPRFDDMMPYEEVKFTFNSITWNHETASSTSTDNWSGE
ncbi:type VI secretion system tube protein TssD [Reinekea sp.]|jgi:type VI secretion system secreted protein Hcp|uniref:type VI secretion system tube protein TssD n=1 Tax=Reinekea sp. TaxID=1970455 RepID=UPI002A80A040|nr:type VI secretion system tube protein TssD [Reinekea sp.]